MLRGGLGAVGFRAVGIVVIGPVFCFRFSCRRSGDTVQREKREQQWQPQPLPPRWQLGSRMYAAPSPVQFATFGPRARMAEMARAGAPSVRSDGV